MEQKNNNIKDDMFSEMRAAGSKLPDIVEALQLAGWRTKNHHDNWYHPLSPNDQFTTHEAYARLSVVDKMKPEQLRFNLKMQKDNGK